MIVVSDTSPLNYLVLVDLQHILPELFERILIPVAVRDELQSAGAPDAIARFMAAHQLILAAVVFRLLSHDSRAAPGCEFRFLLGLGCLQHLEQL